MIESNRFLMVIDNLSDAPSNSPTAFGRLLEDLKSKYFTEIKLANRGQAIWQGIDFEEIMAYGLWVVVIKIAELLKLPLNTEQQAMDIITRADRLVNAGLALAYPDPDARLAAFEQQVLAPLQSAIKLGLQPGMLISSQAWKSLINGHPLDMRKEIAKQTKQPAAGPLTRLYQMCAAAFFAKMVKIARDYWAAANELFLWLKKRSMINESAAGFPIDSDSDMYIAGFHNKAAWRQAIDFLNINRPSLIDEQYLQKLTATTDWLPDLLPELTQAVQRLELLFKCQQRYPYPWLVKHAADQQTKHNHDYETLWYYHQIFLAALNLPDDQTTISPQQASAISQGLQELTEQELIGRILNRLAAHNLTLLPEEQSQLLQTLHTHYCELMANCSNLTDKLYLFLIETMADGRDLESLIKDIKLSPQQAKQLAMDQSLDNNDTSIESIFNKLDCQIDVPPARERTSKQCLQIFYRTQVVDAIIWPEVTIKEAFLMINQGRVPMTELIRGLAQMKFKTRKQALSLVQLIDETHGLTEDLLRPFIDHDAIKVDIALAENFLPAIPKEFMEPLAEQLLRPKKEKKTNNKLLLQILLRCSRPFLTNLLNAYILRSKIGAAIYEDLKSSTPTLTHQEYFELAEKFGMEQWYFLLLSQMASIYLATYEDSKNKDQFTPWDRQSLLDFHGCLFGITSQAQFRTLLTERYTEEAAYQWLINRDPNEQKLLQHFRAARKRFYGK